MKEISLSQGKTTLVDDEDYEWLRQFNWYAVNWKDVWHVRGWVNGEKVRIHRFITDCPKGLQVDHANGNPLDNRRVNLRICTGHQNQGNRRISVNNKSGYKGVRWDKAREKWAAVISIDDHPHFLGRYLEIEAAARAYDAAARKTFGEFARLNFPKGGERKCQ